MSNIADLLKSLSGPELIQKWNQMTGDSVKRFASRTAALARFDRAVSKDPALGKKLLAILTTTVTVVSDPAPAEVAAPAPAPKAPRAPRVSAREAKKVKPIEGSKQGRVNVAGRAVLPQNAKRVLAGEALSGAVAAPPKAEDALDGKARKLNFNYPRKTIIKPLRAGTDREALVKAMSEKGVTVEDVMKMGSLTYEQAVYRIRDLHYTAGHGLVVREGRVYLNDGEK